MMGEVQLQREAAEGRWGGRELLILVLLLFIIFIFLCSPNTLLGACPEDFFTPHCS